MKKKIVTKICSIALAGFIAVSSIPVSEAYATEIENVEDNNQEEQGTDAADDTKSAEKNQGVQEENKDDSENADNGDEAKDAGNDKTKDAAEETTEGTENTEATEETEKTEETETTEAAETEDTEATEETDNQENTEDTTNKDNVSTEGIDKAFQVMDINSMFSRLGSPRRRHAVHQAEECAVAAVRVFVGHLEASAGWQEPPPGRVALHAAQRVLYGRSHPSKGEQVRVVLGQQHQNLDLLRRQCLSLPAPAARARAPAATAASSCP